MSGITDIINVASIFITIICSFISWLQAKKARTYKEDIAKIYNGIEFTQFIETAHTIIADFIELSSRQDWGKGKNTDDDTKEIKKVLMDVNKYINTINEDDGNRLKYLTKETKNYLFAGRYIASLNQKNQMIQYLNEFDLFLQKIKQDQVDNIVKK